MPVPFTSFTVTAYKHKYVIIRQYLSNFFNKIIIHSLKKSYACNFLGKSQAQSFQINFIIKIRLTVFIILVIEVCFKSVIGPRNTKMTIEICRAEKFWKSTCIVGEGC